MRCSGDRWGWGPIAVHVGHGDPDAFRPGQATPATIFPRRRTVLHGQKERGFTLVEVMVATVIFVLLVGLLLSITSQAGKIWQKSENDKGRRQVGRAVLEMIARDFEAAQLPLRSDRSGSLEFTKNPAAIPESYRNRDAIFWQAPVPGQKDGDLQEVGYFVQWVEGENGQPSRGELCRLRVPATNANSIFNNSNAWLSEDKLRTYAPGSKNTNTFQGLLAENVFGLWVTLYGTNNQVMTNSITYTSRSTNAPFSFAEIAIAVADPQTGRRLASEQEVISKYNRENKDFTIEEFVASLPDSIKNGVSVFKTRVRMENSKLLK